MKVKNVEFFRRLLDRFKKIDTIINTENNFAGMWLPIFLCM